MTSGVKREPEEIESLKKRVILYLLEQPGGTFCGACKAINLPLCTAYQWRKEDKDFDIGVIEARAQSDDIGGDLAESKLMQAINNNELTAILFYLKTKHKNRGYVERSEHTAKDGMPFTFTMNIDGHKPDAD